MAAKAIKVSLKLNIEAGKANPAPPVGTALGPHGVNLMEFCKSYNAQTQGKTGIVPVEITVYEDRSFEFILKTPAVSELIIKALGIEMGSGEPHKTKVGKLTKAQVRQIAEEKMADLNAFEIEAAERIIAGTARQMGVGVEE